MLPKGKRMDGDQINLLFSNAKTVKNPLFTMKYSKNSDKKATFAVAPSKKVFKTAVLRNKIKRRIYSAVKSAGLESLPYNIAFIPNTEALNAPYKVLVLNIENVCKSLIKS